MAAGTKNIKIELLQDSETDDVIAFYNRINHANRDKAKFNWEFNNSPAGRSIYVIAKDADTGEIIGTQAAIPIFLVNVNGERMLSAKSEDTLLDPAYRGMKIFDKMYDLLFDECKKNGIRYIWGFTSAYKPFKKLDFDLPFSHSQSVFVRDLAASYTYLSGLNVANTFSDKFKIAGLCLLSKLKAVKANFNNSSVLKLYTHEIFGKSDIKDHSGLFKCALKNNPGIFTIDRSKEFMEWRLIQNPSHPKIFNLYFYKDAEMVANICFNHHLNGTWYLVEDLYCDSVPQEHRVILLRKAIGLLSATENVNLIRTWDFAHNKYNSAQIGLRKQTGFIHLNKGFYFVWKNTDDNDDINPNNFFLSRTASQGLI